MPLCFSSPGKLQWTLAGSWPLSICFPNSSLVSFPMTSWKPKGHLEVFSPIILALSAPVRPKPGNATQVLRVRPRPRTLKQGWERQLVYSSQQHNLTAKELLFCFLYFFQAQLSRFPVDSGHLPSFLFLKTARVGFCCLQSKNPEQCTTFQL